MDKKSAYLRMEGNRLFFCNVPEIIFCFIASYIERKSQVDSSIWLLIALRDNDERIGDIALHIYEKLGFRREGYSGKRYSIIINIMMSILEHEFRDVHMV